MERFLDLSDRKGVVATVLEEWLLRELRDELASRLTWATPALHSVIPGLRVRWDPAHPIEVYYLTPVGIGGKFFYEHPVGEALYSAECRVVVEHEQGALRTRLAEARLYWVGSGDPRGYRISEGFEELLAKVQSSLRDHGRGQPAH